MLSFVLEIVRCIYLIILLHFDMDFKCFDFLERILSHLQTITGCYKSAERKEKKEAAVGSVAVQNPTQIELNVPGCSGGGKAPSPG